MTRMSEEYETRWHSLATTQTETSEAVASLEENLSSVKSLMQSRIGEAEVRLGHLQSWQEKLAGKQDEFQTNVHEELLRIKPALELSIKPAEEHPFVQVIVFFYVQAY